MTASRLTDASVATFADLRQSTIIGVDLPRTPAPAPTTRTVQPTRIGSLVADAQPADFPLRVVISAGAALATSSGLVIAPDGRVVAESFLDDDHRARIYAAPPRIRAAERVSGRCASLVGQWSHNYFHWLIEALPRLAVLQASGVEFDRLIVPASPARFHLEALELLGYGANRIQPFTGEHLLADELVWCSPLAPVGFPTPFLVDWLRSSFGANAPSPPPTRRLYLRRSVRGPANDDEVVALLTSHGFESVDPGTMSLHDQVTLFREATAAVGAHGAAFSNCVFSPHLTAVEIYRRDHANVSTTGLMAAAGHEHWSLAAPRVRSLNRATHQRMHVPVADLEATLGAADLL